MKILAFDTAADGCAIALIDGDRLLAERQETMLRGQDSRLVPMIESVMSEAGVAFETLDRIAVTTGPGSFTGLRVGLATAHGLALASGVPVAGIDCFTLAREAVAQETLSQTSAQLLVVLESKRAELYACWIRQGVQEPSMQTPEQLAELLLAAKDTALTGDAAWRLAECSPALAARMLSPVKANRALVAVRVAAKLPRPDLACLPQPFYLRAPDVTTPRQSAR